MIATFAWDENNLESLGLRPEVGDNPRGFRSPAKPIFITRQSISSSYYFSLLQLPFITSISLRPSTRSHS